MGDNTQRYAVVTGSNKGIGFEIVKQLASSGIKVVLTARDEKKGLEALETLKVSGLSDFVVFHKVDVANAESVVALADFVKSQFGKLDILINNAGVIGTVIQDKKLAALLIMNHGGLSEDDTKKAMSHTNESVEECLKINYYGAKITTEAFLPLLKLSDSPKIVNVSSFMGKLERIPHEWTRQVLGDVDNLSEEKVDEVLKRFLENFKEGKLESDGWPKLTGAYPLSKAALNAHTRIIAKKYPNVCINSVCPGFAKTDMTAYTGISTAEKAASYIVKQALLPHGAPSGEFYDRARVTTF